MGLSIISLNLSMSWSYTKLACHQMVVVSLFKVSGLGFFFLLSDEVMCDYNHRMVWVGRNFKDHPVPIPVPWAGTLSTKPGCPKTPSNVRFSESSFLKWKKTQLLWVKKNGISALRLRARSAASLFAAPGSQRCCTMQWLLTIGALQVEWCSGHAIGHRRLLTCSK